MFCIKLKSKVFRLYIFTLYTPFPSHFPAEKSKSFPNFIKVIKLTMNQELLPASGGRIKTEWKMFIFTPDSGVNCLIDDNFQSLKKYGKQIARRKS